MSCILSLWLLINLFLFLSWRVKFEFVALWISTARWRQWSVRVNNEDWKQKRFSYYSVLHKLTFGVCQVLNDNWNNWPFPWSLHIYWRCCAGCCSKTLCSCSCMDLVVEQSCAVKAGAASLIQFLKHAVSWTTADIYFMSVQYLEEHVDGCTVGVIWWIPGVMG